MTRGRRALFAALALAGGIAASEILVRAVATPAGVQALASDPQDALLTPHVERGYTLRPGASAHFVTPDFDIRIAIGAEGLRDDPTSGAPRGEPLVLAVGDSFTLGLAVAAEGTWVEQLEARLARASDSPRAPRVVNAGVPGYSARQIRLMAEEWIPRIEPDFLVFGLYAASAWRVRTPYALVRGVLVSSAMNVRGDVALYTPFRRPWLAALHLWLMENFELGAHGLSLAHRGFTTLRDLKQANVGVDMEAVRDGFAPVLQELLATARFAESRGVAMVVLLISAQEPDGSFPPIRSAQHQVVTEFCARHGIAVVDPLPELVRRAHGRPIYRTSGGDLHWTPAAHALAAELLAERLARSAGT